MKSFTIENSFKNGKTICLKFKNFETDRDISVLFGKEIFLDKEDRSKLTGDTLLIQDIIGSTVLRNGLTFGIVTDVMLLPANDVYVIKTGNGDEVLIPAVSDYVESFDATAKILVLQPGIEIYENDDEN